MSERLKQIHARVTPQEKKRIAANAEKCKLSLSAYMRQRCLGFAPRVTPPETYYRLCEKLDEASDLPGGEMIPEVLQELRETVILPGRDL